MRILALETTDKIGGVAAIADDNLLAELMLEQGQRSAQSLAPGIDALLKQVGWLPADVQLVAVSIGPGSFTGLRVGVATAKVFAYAVGGEVLGVNTLEVIAANHAGSGCRELSVVIDAQRGEIVVQSFVQQPDGWFEPAGTEELLDGDVWLARLQTGMVVAGPGLVRLLDRMPPGIEMLDQGLWTPRAAAVARLAARHYAKGRRDDVWKLVPHYYRRSAAEEKWDARMAEP
jgi:tRNA threonylcarbamoyladenosine biosynthesis protein TsaB